MGNRESLPGRSDPFQEGGTYTRANDGQFSNASIPMRVTLSGRDNIVRPVHPSKAWSPMVATGHPPREAGITKEVPTGVALVTVAVPFFRV